MMFRVAILTGTLASVCVAQPTQTESRILYAMDKYDAQQFGSAVAISGDVAVVGTQNVITFERDYVYLINAATGVQIARLAPSFGFNDDGFGRSVAIDGGVVLVGASGAPDHLTGELVGVAFLYDATTGQQTGTLVASDRAELDGFGGGVGISGNIAIIGAGGNDDNGNNSGSAYLFDVGTGQELFKLLPLDGAGGDAFGRAVGISGNIAIAGAIGNDDAGGNSGSAYLFDVSTGQQLFKLLPNDGAAADNFGSAVGVSGNVAIVGSPFDDDNGGESGSAYLFDVSTGQQLFKLLPGDGAANQRFGQCVAIDGDVAIVGSLDAAYLFDVSTGQAFAKLVASRLETGYDFGACVAISGGTAIVGSPDDEINTEYTGSAYVFDMVTPPCAGDWDGSGGAPNSSDFLAYLNDWSAQDPSADLAPPGGDGAWDSSDFLAFLNAYSLGC